MERHILVPSGVQPRFLNSGAIRQKKLPVKKINCQNEEEDMKRPIKCLHFNGIDKEFGGKRDDSRVVSLSPIEQTVLKTLSNFCTTIQVLLLLLFSSIVFSFVVLLCDMFSVNNI